MIGAPGGTLDFAGQYAIVTPNGSLRAFDRFAITVPPGRRLPRADGRPRQRDGPLADRIAASITGRRRPTT